MVSAADRILHYNNRMTSSQVDPVLSAVNATAKANYAAHAIEWTDLLATVHAHLSANSVNPSSWFLYDGFAGEIYHLAVKVGATGPAAVAAANDLCLKWEAFGGGLPRLKAICGLFDITVP
jgi:hypothetical protein